MSRKVVGVAVSAFVFIFLLLSQAPPVHAASTIIQQNNAGCDFCSSATLQVSFSSNVASGNVIVVGIEGFLITVTGVSDSLSSSLTQAVTSTDGNDHVYIYYATLSSSGADTITVTFDQASSVENAYVYEVSGVTTVGAATNHDAGSGSSAISAGSVDFQSGAFLLGMIGTENNCSDSPCPRGMTVSSGAGFALSTENSGSRFSHAQYSTSGVSSPTNFPAAITSAFTADYWAEAGIVLTTTPSTTTTASTTTTTFTTGSASTTSTLSTVTATSTLSTATQSPVVTGTTSTTVTVNGPVAGTSTTTYTSILSTSTSTTRTTSSAGETTTQTGVTTTATTSSTSTSTVSALSTTTGGGTYTISEVDTVKVLLTNIIQELHQLADEVLQVLGLQPVATPLGQQVNQVIVTATTGQCVVDAPGNANACGSASAGTFSGFTAVAASSISPPPPSGLTFPDGLFSFTVSGLTPGQTVTVTITLSSPLPAGTFSYWKFQSGVWTQFPFASLDSTRTIITLTLKADSSGTINDPGGPAIGTAIIPEYPYGLPLLVIFMLVAYGLIRRRASNPRNI